MLLPPVTPDRARRIAARASGANVLVIGDAMLDKFIVGRVTRISPEAPVPVVAFDHEMLRMGGAANVAHNIAALGGQATLVAVTGMDDAAATLTHACREAGIAPSLVGDASRPTTTKVRIVTDRNQQVARIDYEATPRSPTRSSAASSARSRRTRRALGDRHLGLPEGMHHRKGGAGRRRQRRTGAPVLVDPKIPHIEYYAGTTLVTPNHHEAEVATNTRVRSEEEARAAARQFRTRAQCANVLMTRGDQGMWLLSSESEGHLPSAAREVADVTGAGDTVIATMAVMLAAGATMSEAARLANEAAGLSVAKFGPATVSLPELLKVVEASAMA